MFKHIPAFAVAVVLCCSLFGSMAFASEDVDAYTSASATRTQLSGDEYDAAVENLIAISNDLATAADAANKASDEASDSALAQVLTVNPDGSVGMSTIHAWKVTETEDGLYVTVVMTDGQNIRNLAEVGNRGTIIVHGDSYYIMHVQTTDVQVLEYSDEAYEAGMFNEDYSGAEAQRCEYTVTFEIYNLESTFLYVFD